MQAASTGDLEGFDDDEGLSASELEQSFSDEFEDPVETSEGTSGKAASTKVSVVLHLFWGNGLRSDRLRLDLCNTLQNIPLKCVCEFEVLTLSFIFVSSVS